MCPSPEAPLGICAVVWKSSRTLLPEVIFDSFNVGTSVSPSWASTLALCLPIARFGQIAQFLTVYLASDLTVLGFVLGGEESSILGYVIRIYSILMSVRIGY